MTFGLVLSTALLLNHGHQTHDRFHCSAKATGNHPCHYLRSYVAEQADVAIYNTTNEWGDLVAESLVQDFEFDSNESLIPETDCEESQRENSTVNGKLDNGGYQEQDDRHDDIIDDIIRHFRGEFVLFDDEGHGSGQGGGEGLETGKDFASSDNSRANAQLPSGWGKTQLALKLIASLYRNDSGLRSAIYVTPYLVLVDQVIDHLNRFGELSNVPHSRLIVASKSNTTEVLTTSADEIAKFLNQNEMSSELRLLICTYHSLPRVGKALSILNGGEKVNSLGLAIFDEAHKMAGVGKRSGYGLYDSLLPTKYRLFLTATPQSYTESPEESQVLGSRLRQDGSNVLLSRRTGRRRKDGVRSFDDASLFGPCVARRTLRESVEQNITVPITLVAIDKDEMLSLLGDSFDPNKSHDDLLPFLLRAAFHKLNVRHAVSFHSLNKRARAFVREAKRIFGKDVTAVSVDGTMSASKRDALLMKAKTAPASVVSNCRLLSTGVDEAEWELVYMADAVTSPVLARQMIGRVSRVAPGKMRGYVLVPVFVGAVDSQDSYPTLAEGSTGYRWFLTAFDAMVADNPILRRDVVYVAEESKKIGRPLLNSEFPESIQEAFILPPSMPIEMKNNLMERVVVEVGGVNSWDRMYELLLGYKEREGHCDVPQLHTEDGFNLGIWLSNQRVNKKWGGLDLPKVQRLEEAGVVWDVFRGRWERMYKLLLQYIQREGHCNVPVLHKEDGSNLGSWLACQRKDKKKGTLNAFRMKRLEEAGVVWDPINDQWEKFCSVLLQFKAREGHCDVPSTHKENGFKIGYWLERQREYKRKGTLDAFRMKRLEEAGVVWDPLNERWENMFALLLQYKRREGDSNVPKMHKENGLNLGLWLTLQRHSKKKGALDAFRMKRLEEAGVVWDPKNDQWEKMYSMLLQFKAREGHCDIPSTHKENGFNIGSWLCKQRRSKRLGKLKEMRLKLLDEVGVTWSSK